MTSWARIGDLRRAVKDSGMRGCGGELDGRTVHSRKRHADVPNEDRGLLAQGPCRVEGVEGASAATVVL